MSYASRNPEHVPEPHGHPLLVHADVLDAAPTQHVAHTLDLKREEYGGRGSGTYDHKASYCLIRHWLHRTGLADGEPFERTVTVEARECPNGSWADVFDYDGDNPDTSTMRLAATDDGLRLLDIIQST